MVDRAVLVYADILQLLGVDEKRGVWQVRMALYLYYDSPSAAWNESSLFEGGEFENVTGSGLLDSVIVAGGTFWTPDIGWSNLNHCFITLSFLLKKSKECECAKAKFLRREFGHAWISLQMYQYFVTNFRYEYF